MSKHTLGPWRLNATTPHVMNSAGAAIADVVLWDKNHTAECEANARLIASAPELLAALQQMLDKYGNKNPAMWDENEAVARAAVSKAIGS